MEKINHLIKKVSQEIEDNKLHNYWPEFKQVAFALFDKEDVYLFNHPNMSKETNENYQIINWNDSFVGCTVILYEEFPTAIVDITLYNDYKSLYAILVHELFHGFQFIREKEYFVNEFLGVTYPIDNKNIQLRSNERYHLYYAVMTQERTKKYNHLRSFVHLREQRTSDIEEFVSYENLIETVEGPAWYVELKAKHEMSDESFYIILEKYGEALLDHFDSNLYIRKSCYSSGLFMCLLLDEFSPKWKEELFNEDVTLLDLIKDIELHDGKKVNDYKINVDSEKIVDFVLKSRQKHFDEFKNEKGSYLIIRGNIKIKSFDPMNMILYENKLLHKRFVKVEINQREYFFSQPVVTVSKGNIMKVNELHLILESKPIENYGSLIIDKIGSFEGEVKKINNYYYLELK